MNFQDAVFFLVTVSADSTSWAADNGTCSLGWAVGGGVPDGDGRDPAAPQRGDTCLAVGGLPVCVWGEGR